LEALIAGKDESHGLARLGHKAALLTELGTDSEGDLIAAHLRSAGVELLLGRRSAAPTPSAVVTLDEAGKAIYASNIRWTLERDRVLPTDPRHVHFGSIAALADPGAETVRSVVRRLSAHATISYDPNVRAMLRGDPAHVIGKAERCIALSDIVKASDHHQHGGSPSSAATMPSRCRAPDVHQRADMAQRVPQRPGRRLFERAQLGRPRKRPTQLRQAPRKTRVMPRAGP
jgi:sugar/nucleoside kinase (ribokinase family)